VRRAVFRKILNKDAWRSGEESSDGGDFPETEINIAADAILPAADFCGRVLFLLALAVSLVLLRPLPALGALLSVPAALLAVWASQAAERKTGSAAREKSEKLEKRFAALLAALPGAACKTPLAGAERCLRDFRKTAGDLCGLRSRAGLASAPVLPLRVCAAGLALALFVYAAGSRFPNEMTRGVWFFCLFAILVVFLNISLMYARAGRFRRVHAAVEKLRTILELEPAIQVSGGESAIRLTGELQLSGLSVFRGEEKLLDGVRLAVSAGQKIALAGTHSNSLSCLLRVLARLHEYDEGELRMDGKDIRTLDIGEFRETIDFVPREAFLFEGTLEENIRCGRPSASDEEIRGATAKLGRGDWLYDLPDGLATRTGPGGPAPVWAPLALLARSLLKRPALCLIDEAAPSLDPLAEVRIQEALYTLIAGRTSVIAARRLSTLRQADRIIVFDKGRVAEEGGHEELLARKGVYAGIYEAGFRHQSPDYFAR
jgi:ABC-type multidrug transport system fused ATPase/permease subunit